MSAVGETQDGHSYFPLDLKEFGKGLGWGVVGAAFLAVSDSYLERGARPLPPSHQQGMTRFINFSTKALPCGSILASIVSIGLVPITEEVFYRGLIRQKQLECSSDSQQNVVSRMIVNSALFASAHFEFRKGLANIRWCIPAFVSGVVFNVLVEKTNNLWASTIAHSAINALCFHKMS